MGNIWCWDDGNNIFSIYINLEQCFFQKTLYIYIVSFLTAVTAEYYDSPQINIHINNSIIYSEMSLSDVLNDSSINKAHFPADLNLTKNFYHFTDWKISIIKRFSHFEFNLKVMYAWVKNKNYPDR